MAKAKTSTQVLKAAKWILENVGWTQGMGTRYEGNKIVALCASAAISYVETENQDVSNRAFDRLSKAIPKKYGHVVNFNDNPKTTKAAVLRAFNRAIKGSK